MANIATFAVVTWLATYFSLSEFSAFVEALAELVLAGVAIYKLSQSIRHDAQDDDHELDDDD